MDILLWHESSGTIRAGCQGITGEIPASDQGAPRKRAVLTDRERERPCEECFQYSGKKCRERGIVPEEMEEQVEDIAGIRIICQFVEDIEKVADLIQKRSDIEIKSEKDYIRHMKDSGYRSYHLIVYYTVETMNGPKRIQVEIQIRTMAMDFWATIEHSLQYKYKANIPDHIRERLSAAAKAIIVLDNEMSSVRSEIMDAQNSSQMQRNLITDILNNIENLYKVTNKREVEKFRMSFITSMRRTICRS